MIYFQISKIPFITGTDLSWDESNALIAEMVQWLKDRNIDCWMEKVRDYEYALVFGRPDEAMLFKLTWM